MKEAYVVVIGWVSPRGTYPTRQQLLALAPEVAEGQPYFKYEFNDLYDETYFFERSEDARAFKSRIEESYNKNPQYFVIDDEGLTTRPATRALRGCPRFT